MMSWLHADEESALAGGVLVCRQAHSEEFRYEPLLLCRQALIDCDTDLSARIPPKTGIGTHG